MAAFHRVANFADPRLRFPPFGSLQAKACPPRPFLARTIAKGPIGLRVRQVTRIKTGDWGLCRRRVDHQGAEYVLGLTAIVGIGSGYYNSQRQGPRITG